MFYDRLIWVVLRFALSCITFMDYLKHSMKIWTHALLFELQGSCFVCESSAVSFDWKVCWYVSQVEEAVSEVDVQLKLDLHFTDNEQQWVSHHFLPLHHPCLCSEWLVLSCCFCSIRSEYSAKYVHFQYAGNDLLLYPSSAGILNIEYCISQFNALDLPCTEWQMKKQHNV